MGIQDEISERIEEMVEAGVLVIDGIDSEGNWEYLIDEEKMKGWDILVYQNYKDELDLDFLSLQTEGYLDLEFSADGEVYIHLTEKSKEIFGAYEK